MPSDGESKVQKHTLFLYRGDYKKLQELYPDNGAALVIRKLIHKFLADVESQTVDTRAVDVEVEL